MARFQHACDTISQVVYKRQSPIIERQVNRLDRAVEKVKQDNTSTTATATATSNPVSTTTTTTTTLEEEALPDASQEIRIVALMRLEEAGEHDAAHRLATLWNMDYVYDQEAMLAAAAARRKKYIQFDEVFFEAAAAAAMIPELISNPPNTPRVLFRILETGTVSPRAFWFGCRMGGQCP